MTDRDEQTIGHGGADDPMATRQGHASSTQGRQFSATLPPPAAVITAELPVQRAPSGAIARRPTGPLRLRRQPAAPALQILVWVLALLLLLVVIVTIVAVVSPSSMTFLRNTTPTALGALHGHLAWDLA